MLTLFLIYFELINHSGEVVKDCLPMVKKVYYEQPTNQDVESVINSRYSDFKIKRIIVKRILIKCPMVSIKEVSKNIEFHMKDSTFHIGKEYSLDRLLLVESINFSENKINVSITYDKQKENKDLSFEAFALMVMHNHFEEFEKIEKDNKYKIISRVKDENKEKSNHKLGWY